MNEEDILEYLIVTNEIDTFTEKSDEDEEESNDENSRNRKKYY